MMITIVVVAYKNDVYVYSPLQMKYAVRLVFIVAHLISRHSHYEKICKTKSV